MFIPISTARRVRPDIGIDVIVARTRSDVHYSAVTRDVREWFRARWEKLELAITSPTRLVEQQEAQMRIMTLLLAAIGSISLIVGTAGTWAVCRFTGWDFFISTGATASGLCMSSAIGIVFGLQPANQASRVDPIVALQG